MEKGKNKWNKERQEKVNQLIDSFREINFVPRYCRNIPKEWDDLRMYIENRMKGLEQSESQGVQRDYSTRFVVSTFINEDTKEIENNIFNLQFFFLCADSIHKKNPNIEVVLIVKCKNSEDAYRVRIYLYIQARFREYLKIAIKLANKGMTSSERNLTCAQECEAYIFPELEERMGKILPLLSVSMTNEKASIAYPDLAETNSEWWEKASNCLDELGNDENFWGKSAKEVLEKILLNNLNCLKELSNSNKIGGQEKKEELIRHIENIKNQILNMSLLAQLIWLYELRYLYEQPDLKEVADYWGDMEMVWEYTRWNAVSYAEGLLQLLENSCQHSCGEIGYLSFRVHDVALSTTNAKVLSVAERRDRLYRRFRINKSDQPLDVTEKSYLEFSVIDDAYDVKKHCACGVAEKAQAQSLEALFWGDKDKQKRKEDILHHYGLELFCINTVLNRGRFLFKSPSEDEEKGCFAAFVNNENIIRTASKVEGDWKPGLSTYYKILVPMIPENMADSQLIFRGKSMGVEPQSLFDDKLLGENRTEEVPKNISGELFFPEGEENLKGILWNCAKSQREKIEYVKQIAKILESQIGELESGKTIIKIELKNYTRNQIELFAKGLFSFMAEKSLPQYNMLYFDSDRSIAEFIRIASVFYNRYGENKWMEKRQIALCGNDESIGCPVVKTVLAGENIAMVNETARTYMYYNPDMSQKLIAQLKYLARKPISNWKGEFVPLYPFDLVKVDGNEKSWFLQRMSRILEKDLQGKSMGCKLRNAHVCLGSRIHIRDFYEAELLFHNMGNVYRFAYCIAERIVKSVDIKNLECQQVILLGYENYSVLLVSEVVRILKQFYNGKSIEIEYMTFVRNKNGKEGIIFSAELKRLQEEKTFSEQKKILKANFVSILPIGSTMSTIYKLINVTTRDLYRRFSDKNDVITRLTFLDHYAVIVVSCKNNKKNHLQDKYWRETVDSEVLELVEEKNSKEKFKPKVKFFLKAETDWYLPQNCPMCGNSSVEDGEKELTYPLGYVDKTSTIPKLIYPAYTSNFRGISFSTEDDNLQKLQKLFGCISYGHISFLNNHFQFFIKFPEYYENCKSGMSKNLNEWFFNQQKQINRSAFNIVVSPLSELEPNFLKEVIDQIFQHNIRFLYIPLNREFKENVRAKFRYFAEEYKKIRKYNPQMPINVYYVDYSIVSAHTLYRGRNLINMLMQESGLSEEIDTYVYKKVFVLLNRSSFDTVKSFVENPGTDYCAYATLAIPSFNTWESSCPICEKVKLYANLAKCSATNELYWYYKRLEEKHSVREPEEYEKWQTSRILLDSGYYRKLVQWFLDSQQIQDSQKGHEVDSKDLSLARWLQNQYVES